MRLLSAVIVLALLAAGHAPAAAAGLDRADFRFMRQLAPLNPGDPVLIEPDGPLFEGSAPGFRDLRILDGAGAEVPWRRAQLPQLVPRPVRSENRRERGRSTVIGLDFGSRRVPVDELRVYTDAQLYDRPVRVFGSNDAERFVPLATARLFRFGGTSSPPFAVRARHRFLTIRIFNGDDEPLRRIDVTAWSGSHAVVLEGGHPGPITLYFGNRGAAAPHYDFARLPAGVLGIEDPVSGRLLPVLENPAFKASEPPEVASSAPHPNLITAALALAALVVGGVGVLVLSRPR